MTVDGIVLGEHLSVIAGLTPLVAEQLKLLTPVERIWQPSDLLPRFVGEQWQNDITALQNEARALPDELLMVLIGNTITEEGLPTYQTATNRSPVIRDPTGVSASPWAQWTRGWTAEERRHGEVLQTYLHLSGRVHMRAVAQTIQHLIRSGFDYLGKSDSEDLAPYDPYLLMFYTSFQELATRVAHQNVGQQAKGRGAERLATICGKIASDETRYATFYRTVAEEIFCQDPSGALVAFADLMKLGVAMPAQRMGTEDHSGRYAHFAAVAERSAIYTIRDYVAILDQLCRAWGVATCTGVSPDAAQAQHYLCTLSGRLTRTAERFAATAARMPPQPVSWLFDRPV